MRGHGVGWAPDRPALAALIGPPLIAGIVLGANQTRAGAYLPWLGSIAYWLTLSFVTWGLMALVTRLARGLLRPWSPPAWSVWLIGAIGGSLVARPAIYTITDGFRPWMRPATLREMRPVSIDLEFLGHYLTNWSVIIAMWLVACWVEQRWRATLANAPQTAPQAATAAGNAATNEFLRRLPAAIGRDVLALQSEDHYVRVHTRLGDTLILATLAEAVRGMERDGIAGQRVHRSWWIANGAVIAAQHRGRRLIAVLGNGVEVPVSQTYREMAKMTGVLTT